MSEILIDKLLDVVEANDFAASPDEEFVAVSRLPSAEREKRSRPSEVRQTSTSLLG
jgi:hypothetical protein